MNDEILQKLNELLKSHEELKLMMEALSNKPNLEDDTWLTKEMIMDKLCITSRTFYRKRERYNWVSKEVAGVRLYLESSLEMR
nr:hypothetical protein [Pedobacter panaciterrae]